MSRGSLIPLDFLLYPLMTSKAPLIHYGLAPFKISTALLKCSWGIFRVPDLLFIIRGGLLI